MFLSGLYPLNILKYLSDVWVSEIGSKKPSKFIWVKYEKLLN